MSTLAIILLILILSISWSSGRNVEDEKSLRKKEAGPETANLDDRMSSNDEILKNPRREKLRKDLQQRMSILVRKIIEARRRKLSRKWAKEKKEDEKMNLMDRYEAPEFPVGNNLEREQDDEDENRRDVIGQTGGEIPQDLATPEPLLARYLRVGGNLASSTKLRANNFDQTQNPISRRTKRAGPSDPWIKRDFKDHENSFKMHALVVRDQDIPPCCSTAQEVTDRRYFMCSGSILSLKHAITTASCMHFAYVHKTEIQADLGVLVGATTPRAYVIKMDRFEMHPQYNFNVDAADHEVHNLAILYLDCNVVPQDVSIPKLPNGFNDDVAHLCCGNHCDIFTIIQLHDNRHIARALKVKHVPSPRHKEESASDQELSSRRSGLSKGGKKLNGSSNLARRIRSSARLAAAPLFFGKDARTVSNDRNSENILFHLARKMDERTKKIDSTQGTNSIKLQNFVRRLNSQNSQGIPLLRALKGVDVEKELAGVNWDQIEETMASRFSEGNRYALESFSKKVVDETMRRLEIVLSDGDDDESSESAGSARPGGSGGSGEGSSGSSPGQQQKGNKIFSKLLPNKKNKTVSDFVKVFTKVVTSLLPPNNNSAIIVSEEPTISANEIENPFPIYRDCPPLGSPVIINDTLIGLLAYSCDDVQNWVEWKYASVAKNMKWIRSKISEQFEPKGRCAESGNAGGPQTRSLVENGREVWSRRRENTWKKKRNEYNDRNVDNRMRTKEETENAKRNEFLRNFENGAGSPGTETSFRISQDAWFARNSQPAPQPQRRPPSSNRAKISVRQNLPVYKFNTCYVKPDGNIDCTSKTHFRNR